jgi:hypothetical protein
LPIETRNSLLVIPFYFPLNRATSSLTYEERVRAALDDSELDCDADGFPELYSTSDDESEEEKKKLSYWGALMPLGMMGGAAALSKAANRIFGGEDDAGALMSEVVDEDDIRNTMGLTSDMYQGGSMSNSTSNLAIPTPGMESAK